MPNPPIGQLSFGELRNMVKREARVSGATDLDDYINTVINELLLDYCLNNRYFEQLQLNVPVDIIDTAGTYALPPDFQVESLVRYQEASSQNVWTIYPRTGYLANPAPGRAGYYKISGASINILPIDRLTIGDNLLLDYYAFPPKLVDDADAFPIPKLIASVKLRSIYRVHIYNNQVQQAQLLKGDASENELRPKRTG